MRDQEVWLDNFESYIPKKAAAGTPSRGEHRHVMFCIREINHVLVVCQAQFVESPTLHDKNERG